MEEITSKTGSFKRFSIFCKMLQAALGNASDSVLAELLTLADLQQLQAQHPRTAATAPVLQNSGKRYFILTYAAEFDRVHYPLPLAADEPTVEQLRNVIRDLREQLSSTQPRPLTRPEIATPTSLQQQRLAAVHTELARLQEDNAALRRRLADNSSWGGPVPQPLPLGVESDVLRELEAERDALAHRLACVERESEAERDACRRDLRRRAREVQVGPWSLPLDVQHGWWRCRRCRLRWRAYAGSWQPVLVGCGA